MTRRLAAGFLSVLLLGCTHSPKSVKVATPMLRDEAASWGVRTSPDPNIPMPLTILSSAGYGCALLDFDQDGWLDLLQVGKPKCRLYRNEGGKRFVERAVPGLDRPGWWLGVTTGDFNSDGITDLALSGYRCMSLLRGTGTGFVEERAPPPDNQWFLSGAFLDVDGDGSLEYYAAAYLRFGPQDRQLCEYAGLPGACGPGRYSAQRGRLLRRTAAGWTDVTREWGLQAGHGKTMGVVVSDFNHDLRPDLYCANDMVPGDLFLSGPQRYRESAMKSGVALAESGFEQAGMGVDSVDADGDGNPEILVTTYQHEPVAFYRGQSDALFSEQGKAAGLAEPTVEQLGFGAHFLDLDNDGDQDLLIANGHLRDRISEMQPGVPFRQDVQCFLNERGVFQEAPQVVGRRDTASAIRPIVGRGLAVGDLDNDGRMDAVATDLLGPPVILRNTGSRLGHWLRIRLVGSRSPRDGSGAWVTLEANGRAQHRYSTTSGSYLSASDPRLHFGIGERASSVGVRVSWPSGSVSELTLIGVDREHTIREPGGTPEP